MPKAYLMTWVAESRRWRKHHEGKFYSVSCRQLGTPETKEASWRAANAWWEEKQKLLDLPPEDDRLQRAARIRNLVRDFSRLDDDSRREAVEALLGPGAFDSLKSQASAMLAGVETPSPERTVAAQVEAWKALLRSACQSGQISEGRYDAYCRRIRPFMEWIGPGTGVDAIDEARLEGFFNHLSARVEAGEFAPSSAH